MNKINFAELDNLTKEEKYRTITPQIFSLIEGEENVIANLANIAAVLKSTFEYYLWVGFYLIDVKNKSELVIGPYQGKVACTRLKVGNGVCGTAVEKKQTILVENVNDFPGHIFCDTESKSEIVVPLMNNNEVYAVLDVDSGELSAFDETDKKYLEEITGKINYRF